MFVVLALFASACSGDDATSSVGTLAVATAIPAVPLEGDSIDGFAPDFDDGVVIVGYGVGDTIELRARPGVEQLVLAQIPGNAVELSGLGETFVTPDDRTWWFVRWQDTQGWIEPGAGYLGASTDITADATAGLTAATYESAIDIVLDVSAHLSANESDEMVVVSTAPSTTGGASVTIADVLIADREPDERQLGQRLEITTTGADGNFSLQSVAQRPLCGRGLTDQGACT